MSIKKKALLAVGISKSWGFLTKEGPSLVK
jgi:hypothetical protein